MKYSMLIKCDKCGYENFPQHRFCGMCAAELTIPQVPSVPGAPVPQAAAKPRPVVSKPSAIKPAVSKLDREPVQARNLSYLLDDEPAPSRSGLYVWIFVLLLVGAAAAWHWRDDLGPLIAKFSNRSGGASGQTNSSAPEIPPAPPATDQPQKPTTETQGQTASPPPAAKQAETVPPPDQSASTAAPQGEAPPEMPAVTAPKSAPKPVPSAAPPPSSTEDMEAEGEKYLYGDGVPENCGRARKSLLEAASRSSAKAQNVLGTMYATGHCATRDLPTAYRWFGRSLRQNPGNTRIEQDLKVLWNQMTPEERQVALRNNQ